MIDKWGIIQTSVFGWVHLGEVKNVCILAWVTVAILK